MRVTNKRHGGSRGQATGSGQCTTLNARKANQKGQRHTPCRSSKLSAKPQANQRRDEIVDEQGEEGGREGGAALYFGVRQLPYITRSYGRQLLSQRQRSLFPVVLLADLWAASARARRLGARLGLLGRCQAHCLAKCKGRTSASLVFVVASARTSSNCRSSRSYMYNTIDKIIDLL